MKAAKQIKRDAKRLFRMCRLSHSLDENGVRQVVENILKSKRRGHLALATEFERLVRLDQLQHEARVESATPSPSDVRANVQASLIQTYGPELSMSFVANLR